MRRAPERVRYPEYATLDSRLATFTHWPHTSNAAYIYATPFTMALEGFFQSGDPTSDARGPTGDACICFSCGCELQRWEATDHPGIEHAKTMSTGGDEPISHQCWVITQREESGIKPSHTAIQNGCTRMTSEHNNAAGTNALADALDRLKEKFTRIDSMRLSSSPLGLGGASRVPLRSPSGAAATGTSSSHPRDATPKPNNDRADPLFLPIPHEHIHAAVYTTPNLPSKPIQVANASSSYSDSLVDSAPLSSFDRLRHRHLKRSRSVWSAMQYPDLPPQAPDSGELDFPSDASRSSFDAAAATTATGPAAPSSHAHLSELTDLRYTYTALERKLSSLLRKRARTTMATGATLTTPSDGVADVQSQLQQVQAQIHELQSRSARPNTISRTPTVTRALKRTIFAQEVVTAMMMLDY